MLEFEFLYSILIRGDSSALDSDLALSNSVSGVNSNLIVGGVSVLDAQVEVLNVKIKIRQDMLKSEKVNVNKTVFSCDLFNLPFA